MINSLKLDKNWGKSIERHVSLWSSFTENTYFLGYDTEHISKMTRGTYNKWQLTGNSVEDSKITIDQKQKPTEKMNVDRKRKLALLSHNAFITI